MAISLCTACGEVFYSETSFVMHRDGSFKEPYGKGRRCLTTQEMLQKGMSKNTEGQWIGSPNSRFDKSEGDRDER